MKRKEKIQMTQQQYQKIMHDLDHLLSLKPQTIIVHNIGHLLREIRCKKAFFLKRCSTFDEWLDSDNCKMRKRTAYNFIRVSTVVDFVSKRTNSREIFELEYSKVIKLAPKIFKLKDPKEITKLLVKTLVETRDRIAIKKKHQMFGSAFVHQISSNANPKVGRSIVLRQVQIDAYGHAGDKILCKVFANKKVRFSILVTN